MIFMDRNCILIEIFQCLQLVSIGLLLTTCVCFEPEPVREGVFHAIMTYALSQSILSQMLSVDVGSDLLFH